MYIASSQSDKCSDCNATCRQSQLKALEQRRKIWRKGFPNLWRWHSHRKTSLRDFQRPALAFQKGCHGWEDGAKWTLHDVTRKGEIIRGDCGGDLRWQHESGDWISWKVHVIILLVLMTTTKLGRVSVSSRRLTLWRGCRRSATRGRHISQLQIANTNTTEGQHFDTYHWLYQIIGCWQVMTT